MRKETQFKDAFNKDVDYAVYYYTSNTTKKEYRSIYRDKELTDLATVSELKSLATKVVFTDVDANAGNANYMQKPFAFYFKEAEYSEEYGYIIGPIAVFAVYKSVTGARSSILELNVDETIYPEDVAETPSMPTLSEESEDTEIYSEEAKDTNL